MCDICLFKRFKANTFSVTFGGVDKVSNASSDKQPATTRQSAPCGKFKCGTSKNLCIAYTPVSTHDHFFSLALSVFFFFFSQWKSFTQKTHISGPVVSPPTWWRLKFISLTLDKPVPALSGTGSGVIKDYWCNRSHSALSRKKKRRGAALSKLSGNIHTHIHKKCTPESTLTNSLTSCG